MTEQQMRTSLGGVEISFLLKRSSKRRSVGLRIDGAGLTVSVPSRMQQSKVDGILREKADWILRKIAEFGSRAAAETRWESGEAIPFLGEQLTLRLYPAARNRVEQVGGELNAWLKAADDPQQVESAVASWYRRQALELFERRVGHYSSLLGRSPEKILLSGARTRWGSCSSSGQIRLNWRLIKLPIELIDYVVAHELSHLVEMNHSEAFWRVVERLYPKHREARILLREHARGNM